MDKFFTVINARNFDDSIILNYLRICRVPQQTVCFLLHNALVGRAEQKLDNFQSLMLFLSRPVKSGVYFGKSFNLWLVRFGGASGNPGWAWRTFPSRVCEGAPWTACCLGALHFGRTFQWRKSVMDHADAFFRHDTKKMQMCGFIYLFAVFICDKTFTFSWTGTQQWCQSNSAQSIRDCGQEKASESSQGVTEQLVTCYSMYQFTHKR